MSLIVPQPVVDLANTILATTPAKQPEGDPIRKDPGKLATRLMGILGADTPGVTPDVLRLAWKLYLGSHPKAIKAPQYFFGEAEHQGANGANWLEWARLAYRKNSNPASTTGSPTPEAQRSEGQGQVGVDAAKLETR